MCPLYKTLSKFYLLFRLLAVCLSTGARLGWMLQDLVNQTELHGLAGVHELVPLQ